MTAPEPCTGITARWCAQHGTCTCPDGRMDMPACPVHGWLSDHPATPEPHPAGRDLAAMEGQPR